MAVTHVHSPLLSARPPCSAPASWARRSPRISSTPAFRCCCSTCRRRKATPTGSSRKAIDNLEKLEPAPLAAKDRAAAIEAANYGSDLARLRECDLVIEAIAERMDWKHDLYAKVAPHLAPHAVFASNTSGLSITALSEALPASAAAALLRRALLQSAALHAPGRADRRRRDTDPALLDALETFLTTTLGKGVIRAKDTPNFIANRIGVFSMLATMHHTQTLRPVASTSSTR